MSMKQKETSTSLSPSLSVMDAADDETTTEELCGKGRNTTIDTTCGDTLDKASSSVSSKISSLEVSCSSADVQEIQQQPPPPQTTIHTGASRKRGTRVTMVLLVTVVLLLAITFPIVFKLGRDQSDTTIPAYQQTHQEHMSILTKLVPGVSNYTLDALMSPYSLQFEAYQSIQLDPNWETYEDWRKRQRYAMACLWFAFRRRVALFYTQHECQWGNWGNSRQVTMCGDGGRVLGVSWTGVAWTSRRSLPGSRFLPPEISLLSQLEVLDLSGSRFRRIAGFEGTHIDVQDLLPLDIPDAFPSLKALKVSDCTGLQGSLPSTLGLLTSLTQLDFSINEIGSTIPTELGLLSNLTSLYLQFNDLNGTIPIELGDLPHLTHLNVEDNGIEEFIPAGFCNKSHIPMEEFTTNWCWDGSPCC